MTQLSESATLPVMAPATDDFDFLEGSFDVFIRRLSDPLDPGSDWVTEQAASVARSHFAGALNVQETWLPTEQAYGLALRLFDPAAREWTIRQVSSADGRLRSPLVGRFVDGTGTFSGAGDIGDQAVDLRIVWKNITDTAATSEQHLSRDGGETWGLTSICDFRRRDNDSEHRLGPRRTADFDFLTGWWYVHHRRLLGAASDGTEWVEFDSMHRGRTYFNGAVSTDEISLATPGERGFTFRTFDPADEQWSIYWVSSGDGHLQPPVRGRFSDGVGTFLGVEEINGRQVHVRFLWTGITDRTATWRQEFSFDGGSTWAENWEMRFTRDRSRP